MPLIARAGALPFGIFLALTLAFPPGGATATEEEARRTWERAVVMIDLKEGGFLHGRMDQGDTREALSRLPAGLRLPTVIYLHGCSGLTGGNYDYAALLALAGYAVLMPDSFARQHRPLTCDPRRYRGIPGAPHREVAEMRQEEVRYAARRALELPWVDPENLFLMGHSQGGTAAGEYGGGEFKAHIVSGSLCVRGLRAPTATPVLVVVSERDPWFRGRSPRACLEKGAGRQGPLELRLFPGDRHNLSGHPEARGAILDFLSRHATRRR